MMCEVGFVFALDAFHRRIEVSEFDVGELFVDQFHELFYTYELSCFGDADLTHIPVGVDVEIAPLDHCQVCLADELAQGFVFLYAVGHSGENKIVDAGPAAVAADDFEAFHDVIKCIIVGAVVGCVDRSAGGVEADADAVQACFAEGSYCGGFAAVGIDIDAAAVRVFAHFYDGLADGLPH